MDDQAPPPRARKGFAGLGDFLRRLGMLFHLNPRRP
jgi:hypothetical protein